MKRHFTISEFCITDDPIPLSVADKILRHIDTLNPIREELGSPVFVSERSGYRPKAYELTKGRSGNSHHTFANNDGAADLTSPCLPALLKLLIEKSDYTRIAYYPNAGFIHCDYAPTASGKREFYHSSNSSKWEFKEYI